MNADTCPAAYRPEEFVNREEEIDLIWHKVGQACSGGVVDRPIVHFHSAPRTGKTWLLSHLAHLYAHPPCSAASTHKAVAVIVDCDAVARAADVRTALFQACRRKWQAEMEDSRYRRLGTAQDLPALAKALCALLPERVPLLLFDAADALDADDFDWLEGHFLDPLARTDRTVIVVSGTSDVPHWRRFETRRRIHYRPLRAFNADETAEQMRKAGLAAPGIEVHRLSGGHPYASRLLAEARWPPEDDRVAALLQPVEAELLRNVSPELRDGVRVLAVIRRFIHIASLRFFLSRLVPAAWEERSDAFYLHFLRRLQRDQLLRGGPDQYAFVPVVRRVLLQRLRLADPKMYRESHQVAIELYEGWMKAYPQDCGRFVLEVIYHYVASRASVGGPEEAFGDGLWELLDGWLLPHNFTADQAHALYRSVQDDRELLQITPPSVYEALLERTKRLPVGRT
jgi:hypothetical protein